MDPTGSMSLNISGGSTAIDGEYQPAVPRQKPPLQEITYIRRDVPPITQLNGIKSQKPQNNDVGDFINSKLREIDNDPVQPPYDSLQEYAYEGEGSLYGSTLSSLELNKLDENSTPNRLSTYSNALNKDVENLESDLDQIKNWGPKFYKISNIYGLADYQDET